jgi:hypothetical protein
VTKTVLGKFLAFLSVLATLYATICLVLFFLQRSLIYYPQPRRFGTPESTQTLTTALGSAVVSQHSQLSKRAVVYFGGNAEDVSYTAKELAGAFPDFAVFALHYPGYGGSSGTPNEASIFSAAALLMKHVQESGAEAVLIGRSLGSGVAMQMATRFPVHALVLITPFDSLDAVAARHFPWLPVRWILRDHYRSDLAAPMIRVPTLIVAAEHDQVIPVPHAQALFERFEQGTAQFVSIAKSDHNDIDQSPDYWRQLSGFLGKSPKGKDDRH